MSFDKILSLKGRILLYLADRGAFTDVIELSTIKLARDLGISQQSASRLLIELEGEKLIERRDLGRTRGVRLTEDALKILLEMHAHLKNIFEKPAELSLEGRVFTGFGEGAYYTQIPHYVKEFEEKLGFKPYPGTLNIRLIRHDDLLKRMILERAADIVIEGFSDGRRAYGGAKCIFAKLDGEEVVIIFIDRTHYSKDVIEVIAPICLREKLKLSDGDRVRLTVKLNPTYLIRC
ncbi:MAG: DUF120 domain-containing protein [Thaumarchaeota archaeon]|nr:DUF120 domain-containing protein [Nitrososphaerota archaeon]